MKLYACSGFAAVVCLAFVFGGRQVAAQDHVIITEFVAQNLDGLVDGDREHHDWIELFNPTEEPINLEGYWLTDNPEQLKKWEFPAVTIGPKQFLVVFASEKDRRDPARELHTNFRLDRGGELLALLAPDGTNVITGFPSFPPQVMDTAYGVGSDSRFLFPVQTDAPVRVLVPTDASVDSTWMNPDFDDSDWREGLFGVGIERSPGTSRSYDDLIRTDVEAEMFEVNATVYMRTTFEVNGVASVDQMFFRLHYDDGFVAYLNGERIASDNAPPDEELAWNSESDGSHADSAALRLSEFDVTEFRGLLREGANVLAIHGMNSSPTNSDLVFAPELEIIDIGPIDVERVQFFAEPTPGAINGQGFDRAAGDAEILKPAGAYVGSAMVELQTEEEGGVIRFTTNGRAPDETSTIYEGPIEVTGSQTLTARVFVDGAVPGQPVNATYMIVDERMNDVSSNLPIVLIDTFGRPLNENNFTRVHAQVIDLDEDGRARVGAPIDFQGRAAMKLRGSSSLGFPKKQYSFEVQDEEGEDKAVSILGMSEHADWILQAPYSDKSLMRNVLSYEWSNAAGRYATRTKFCEVYLNTRGGARLGASASDYLGVYVFMEKIKRSPDRVPIDRLDPSHNAEPEITGGYILKKDRPDPGDVGFRTSRGQELRFYYPKEENITTAQANYIRNYINRFEGALYGSRFRDPELGYANYIDVGSFIDHHIMVEITKNIDGYRLSTFMYKPRGEKLVLGPIWDYNLSLGNADYLNGFNPSGWYYPQLSSNDYPWFPRLFQDPGFREAYANRWIQLREEVFTYRYLLNTVDNHASLLEESQGRNFNRWRILGTRVWPNWHIAATWRIEVDWMKGWIENRVGWMDAQFVTLPRAPEFNRDDGEITAGETVEISTEEEGVVVFYTLDGSDPRSATEGVVQRYEGPITIDQNTRVRARARRGTEFWSGMATITLLTEFPTLRITEFMYHPPEPTAEENPNGEFRKGDFEWIELQNVGTTATDLSIYRIARGVTFDFTTADPPMLGPGEFAVIVNDLPAFEARYGGTEGIRVLGEFTGSLSDRAERVTLTGDFDLDVVSFSYDDDWFPETDGGGYSLVIRDATADVSTWDDEASWQQSDELLGSPGRGVSVGGSGLQRPGDISQDGELQIDDALALLNFYFAGAGVALPCGDGTTLDASNLALLDSDGSGRLNVSDVVHVLLFLFAGEQAPVLGTECVELVGCADGCAR